MMKGPDCTKIAPKNSLVQYPKTDVRYWREKIERHGKVYSVQIFKDGERHRFSLETPNKVNASKTAQAIYLELLSNGWASALAKFGSTKHEHVQTVGKGRTVGDLIMASRALSTARTESLDAYEKAFRKIVSEVANIDSGKKYDSKKGGAKTWRQKVDSVPLAKLTPAKITEWKVARLKSSGSGATSTRQATNTVNSLIRNAKALFARKVLPFLAEKVALPSPLPFETVAMEKAPSVRYHSKMDARKVISQARSSLVDDDPEAFKALILSLVCGLRRSESDHLQWNAVDFEAAVLRIENTEFKRLKSEDSAGEIDLDFETLQLFRNWRIQAPDDLFILKSRFSTSRGRKSRSYRCDATFIRLCRWLRDHGVLESRPIHTLRKEIGSIIADQEGIFAASKYLRHSDISITARIYADKKRRIVAGLLGS